MTDDAQGHIVCPHCDKRYRWKQQYAGQRVKCKACGGVLVMPIVPPDMPLESASMRTSTPSETQDDAGHYQLDTPEDQATFATPQGKCPHCGQSVKPTAVICLNCGFNLKEGTRLETQVVEGAANAGTEPSANQSAPASAAPGLADDELDLKKTEIYLPLGLIAAGVVMILLDSFVLLDTQYIASTSGAASSMTLRLLYLAAKGIQTAIQIPLLFAGILVIGMFFGTSFSSIGSAVLKFLAVALFLTGFGGCIDSLLDRMTGGFGGMAWMLRTSITFPAFWGINALLFDLEFLEVIILYVVMIMAPVFLMVFVFAMLVA
jgi:uncharacterized OB-fold protein